MTMYKLDQEITEKFIEKEKRQPSAQERTAMLSEEEKYNHLLTVIDDLRARVDAMEKK